MYLARIKLYCLIYWWVSLSGGVLVLTTAVVGSIYVVQMLMFGGGNMMNPPSFLLFPHCRWRRASLMAGLKLLAFVARYVLVYAGSVTLLDRAEGGIEVRRIDRFAFAAVDVFRASVCSFDPRNGTSRHLTLFSTGKALFTPHLFFAQLLCAPRLILLRTT